MMPSPRSAIDEGSGTPSVMIMCASCTRAFLTPTMSEKLTELSLIAMMFSVPTSGEKSCGERTFVVAFLWRTQRNDASWFLASRSRAFQLYFESGFSYGKDQFIAVGASGWAAAAQAIAMPPTP